MLISESLGRDAARLVIWFPFRWGLELLPLRWGYGVLAALGRLHARAGGGAQAARNLRLTFPERDASWLREQRRLFLQTHYTSQLQIFLFPHMSARNCDEVLEVEGLDHLRAALRDGRGAILLHGHYGPIQLPLHVLGLRGWPVMQLGYLTDEGLSPVGRRVSFELRKRYEARIRAPIIMKNQYLKPLFEWLGHNRVLFMTGDGAGGTPLTGRLVSLPFLGRRMAFPAGAASLARKTGAAVLMMTTGSGTSALFRTRIEPPFRVPATRDADADVAAAVERFATYFETFLRQKPGPWLFWDELQDRFAASAALPERAPVTVRPGGGSF